MSKEAQHEMKMQYSFTEVLREGPNPEKKLGGRKEQNVNLSCSLDDFKKMGGLE